MNKKILLPTCMILLVAIFFSTFGTVAATQPKLSYSLTLVSVKIEPGTSFLSADKIMHTTNAVAHQVIFSSPWGDGTGISIGNSNLNMIDFTGNGEQHNIDTYDSGVVEGTTKYTLDGVGSHTYYGPKFEYNGFTVESGMTFGGLLISGITIKKGIDGDLDGLQMRGTWSGVSILEPYGPPQLWGASIVSATGEYW